MNDTSPQADAAPANGTRVDVNKLMELLPHRYPMLMIDAMEDIVPGESATGIKNVTMNEPHFTGHFPGHPVMPGVLIVEAMAQTAAALVAYSFPEDMKDKVVYFMSVDRARFRHPVVPGDHLRVEVKKIRTRGPVWRFEGKAKVGEKVCAEAEYAAMSLKP